MTPAFFKSATINSATSQDLLKVYFPFTKSIAVSSDIYYYWLATQLGVDKIHDFMQQWKFGAKTGIDLVGEQTGILPSRDWKEARFKEPWYVGDTPSLGIGQGYNAFTLLQLALATATLANRGIIMTPHLVDKIENPVTGESIKVDAEPTGKIPLKDANLDVVIAGMTDVTRTGTALSVFQGAPLLCSREDWYCTGHQYCARRSLG